MKIYAIALTKGWVELRRADKPPKARTTQSIRVVKERQEDFDYDSWTYRTKYVPRNLKITVTTYTGGKVIKTVKARRFSDLTKVSIHKGGCLELPEEMARKVMETW